MFSPLGLFSKITCPVHHVCDLPNCVFSHEEAQSQRTGRQTPAEELEQLNSRKRRKLDTHVEAQAVPIDRPMSASFIGRLVKSPPTPPSEVDESPALEGSADSGSRELRNVRSISPPPLTRPHAVPVVQSCRPVATVSQKAETLNPRKLLKPPASHASRMIYLKKLHELMSNLNEKTGKSDDPEVKALKMDAVDLVRLALDEEEKIASEHTTVYPNVIKLRMVSLSKMTLEQWKLERLQVDSEGKSRSKLPENVQMRDLSTGLTTAQEIQVLPHLFADQEKLKPFGYVTCPPTESEVRCAQEGVEASQGWEVCDRCKSRFQVFPNRREDGSLTGGGTCKYHHGRANWAGKGETHSGAREKTYTCCNEAIGVTTGCTTHETHVFKVNDAKRLASILQFAQTPENPKAPPDRAVAFDCEMAYTVQGMELIRLTATSWPDGDELLDVLVKPFGAVLDLNTRYSGVSADIFVSALPYGTSSPVPALVAGPKTLCIVDSPKRARELLFQLISPTTPLIGHAIENDLNVTRIIHPSIIDTVLLFPARGGLPSRRALRALAKEMLWRDIQVAGAKGHDSKEDANAAMDLVRVSLGTQWRNMERTGWRFVEGRLTAPVQQAQPQHEARSAPVGAEPREQTHKRQRDPDE